MKYFIKKIKFLLSKKLQAKSYQLLPTSYKLPATRGFTLIETLVAISILMIAVASPLTIAQKGLTSAIYAKDQITASYLAQDAIEYIRNKIDKNVANSKNWLDGILIPCGTMCTVDTLDVGKIEQCTLTDGYCNSPLKYNDTDHTYRQDGSINSPFTRSVKVTEENTGIEALITVTMSWTDKSSPRSFVVSARVFNWR